MEAQEDFMPLSLRDVPLQKSDVEWADIGGACFLLSISIVSSFIMVAGLKNTKLVLRETLEWPTKYAQLFKQSPLRLRSGCVSNNFFVEDKIYLSHIGCSCTAIRVAEKHYLRQPLRKSVG